MDAEEIQNMIDVSIAKAMAHHNRTASLISFIIGSILLFFYAHGVLMIVEKMK